MGRAKRKRKRKGQPSNEPAAGAAVALVLGDEDLLGEILLRLDYPTCLVRAAAVCRRWLRCASDPSFLRRFRTLHPPRILGIRVMDGGYPIRFFPIPQPKEMAAVAARVARALPDAVSYDCRNGRLLFWRDAWTNSCAAIRAILQPGPDEPLPSQPFFIPWNPTFDGVFHFQFRLLLQDDGDVTSFLYLLLAYDGVQFAPISSSYKPGSWDARVVQ